MTEEIIVNKHADKEQQYKELVPQIKALVEGENNTIANLANISSALYFGMEFFWVGFYIVENKELILGPFHGPVACTRIGFGKGVCGTAWEKNQTVIAPDVDKFPGHIACSSASKSEIVVPGINSNGQVVFVLDVDSSKTDNFNETDRLYLEEIVQFIIQQNYR